MVGAGRAGARRAFGLAAAVTGAAGILSCTDDPPPRPQLVVLIDTDAALVGQLVDPAVPLAAGGAPSPALAIDTVRVDLVSDEREVTDYRDFTAPDVRDWPVSFGIASANNTRRIVRLRIRAFRASQASKGVLGALTTVEPESNLAIDRIVEVPQPESGVQTIRVTLSAACFGAPASFSAPLRTCIDGAQRSGLPTDAIVIGGTAAPSRAGTALEAREQPCAGPSPTGAVCVPGGPSVLGDPRVANIVEGPSTAPRRPVLLSPFHMDRTELTVGRYRTLLREGKLKLLPVARTASELGRYCTWLDPATPTNDRLPLNCVSYDAALAACEAGGGSLPTEAQWEHAARGRGRGYAFPWGETDPSCCSASASRPSVLTTELAECGKDEGIEPVGSHAGKGCVPEDVTLDGVVDLAGSVKEMILDGGLSYAESCWTAPGLVLDPRCALPDLAPGRTARGGEWSAGIGVLRSALRAFGAHEANTVGFRCVYRDKR